MVANNKRATGFSKNAVHDNLVVNNIFYEPNGQSMNFLGQPRDTVIDFNCYFARYGEMPGANSIKADPRFVDPAKQNFRLRPNSPSINAGRTVAADMIDFLGNSLRGKPDIGAYESAR